MTDAKDYRSSGNDSFIILVRENKGNSKGTTKLCHIKADVRLLMDNKANPGNEP